MPAPWEGLPLRRGTAFPVLFKPGWACSCGFPLGLCSAHWRPVCATPCQPRLPTAGPSVRFAKRCPHKRALVLSGAVPSWPVGVAGGRIDWFSDVQQPYTRTGSTWLWHMFLFHPLPDLVCPCLLRIFCTEVHGSYWTGFSLLLRVLVAVLVDPGIRVVPARECVLSCPPEGSV